MHLPSQRPQPGPKFDYKLGWFDRLIKHARSLNKENVPVILAGDYNVVQDLSIDIYPTRSWDKDALTQPKPRARFKTLFDDGWLDFVRTKHPGERVYSYRDYKRQRWERNGGLRLEGPSLAGLLAEERRCSLDYKGRSVFGWERGDIPGDADAHRDRTGLSNVRT